ncbi:MAG: adenylyl-sulfate kinase [Gammaproteobacteria bacterium]
MPDKEKPKAENIVWQHHVVTRAMRERHNGHRAVVLWFTGLSGAGKSSIACALEQRLHTAGCQTYVCDGDNIRHGLNRDLGFSPQDRSENIRRIAEVAKLMLDAGLIVMTAFISPYRHDRALARQRIGNQDFVEIYCRCSVEECERRDVKGLYRKARAGEIREFTGVSAPYEVPETADIVLDTVSNSIDQCIEIVLTHLRERGVLGNGHLV